jgi:hypothetical protein
VRGRARRASRSGCADASSSARRRAGSPARSEPRHASTATGGGAWRAGCARPGTGTPAGRAERACRAVVGRDAASPRARPGTARVTVVAGARRARRRPRPRRAVAPPRDPHRAAPHHDRVRLDPPHRRGGDQRHRARARPRWDSFRSERVERLSGGMRRRLGLAQALLGSPSLLVLDEPGAGLDPDERLRLREILTERRRTTTVFVSTHLTDEAAISDTVLVLDRGGIRFAGPPDRLASIARAGRGSSTRSRRPTYAPAGVSPTAVTAASARHPRVPNWSSRPSRTATSSSATARPCSGRATSSADVRPGPTARASPVRSVHRGCGSAPARLPPWGTPGW